MSKVETWAVRRRWQSCGRIVGFRTPHRDRNSAGRSAAEIAAPRRRAAELNDRTIDAAKNGDLNAALALLRQRSRSRPTMRRSGNWAGARGARGRAAAKAKTATQGRSAASSILRARWLPTRRCSGLSFDRARLVRRPAAGLAFGRPRRRSPVEPGQSLQFGAGGR
jgi:hypothetical protein